MTTKNIKINIAIKDDDLNKVTLLVDKDSERISIFELLGVLDFLKDKLMKDHNGCSEVQNRLH